MFKFSFISLFVVVCVAPQLYADPSVRSSVALPHGVTNNAVAYLKIDDIEYLASFAGLGASLTQSDIHSNVWLRRFDQPKWRLVGKIPNAQGRLASVAVTVANKMYVFGGYTVAPDGEEISLPYVHAFDPGEGRFTERKPMPVPVDDSVALVYKNRYVYLVSGWHDVGNVNLVQQYDTLTNSWAQATPFPGAPVFGHAGAIVGDQLLICGGSRIAVHEEKPREFLLSKTCYRGLVNAKDSRRIQWRPVADPYGASRYRAVAAALDQGVVFIGGTDRPYNYNGIGYDGKPAEPLPEMLEYNFKTHQWQRLGLLASPSMDHRGVIVRNKELLLIGGMLGHQKVTGEVRAIFFE